MAEQERQVGDLEYGKETGREWVGGEQTGPEPRHIPTPTSDRPVAADTLRPDSKGGEASDVEGHGATYRGGG